MSNLLLNRSLHPARWLVSVAWLVFALGTPAHGQTLLYKWNFDNATGSGTSLAMPPAVVDTTDGYTGGNLSLFVTNGFTVSTPASSGLNGSTNAADLGLVNSAIYNSAGSVMAGVVGDMSKITNFTVTLWFKLNAGVTNFNTVNGAGLNSRLFCIDTNKNGTGGTAADGNELYLGLAQPSGTGTPVRIQFGVFIPSGQPFAEPFDGIGGGSPATFTNQWVFICAVYTPAANGTAQIYVGTTNAGASLTATMTGVGALTNGVKTWLSTSNLVEIGNRVSGTGNRALMGAIDDVRLYGNALTLAQVQAVQGVVSPPGIIAQPLPVVAFPGQTPKLSVAANGTLPLAYHWMRNGTNLVDGGNISGSTSNVLTISGFSADDAFTNYSAVITNVAGSITSSVVSVSLTTANGAYESAVIADAPFAFYTFSETNDPVITDPDSGSYNPAAPLVEAYDSIGSFNGTYGTATQNGADGITGPQATANGLIGFPDTNTALGTTYLDLPPTSYVSLPPFNLNNGAGTNVLTITAWINPSGPQAHAAPILLSRSGTTVAGLVYNATNGDGNLRLGYNWNNEVVTYTWDSGLVPTPGLWSLVALVVTPTNATIYVINTNGLLFSTFVHNHVPQIFEGPTLIGNDSQVANGSRTFNGSIDEVALFGQALTADQLAALFNAASGILFMPVAPIIVTEPVWPAAIYAGQSASASTTATGATSFQWQAGLSGIYTNLTDGPNISGSATATLTINSVQPSNALDYVVVVTNLYGATNSSPPATLTITPSGPPQDFTFDLGGTPIVEAPGTDWNTVNNWNPNGQPASVSAYSNPGSTYTIVVGSRLRSTLSSNSIFPGVELVIEGDGVYENSTVVNVGELRIKHTGFSPATNYYSHLALDGGEVLNGDPGLLVLQGWVDIQTNSVFYLDSNDGRTERIDAWLTGSGNIFWHDASVANSTNDFNVTGATNTFSGQWIVDQGGLLGSGANSLGTNSISVGMSGLVAAVETLYNINNTNASLMLGANGQVYLHQSDHFASVVVNGTPLGSGTYPFSYLNGQYPVNFPATWTQQVGSTFNTGSGQIIVGSGVPPSSPHITGISLSGTSLSISATNGSPGGFWTLLQSSDVTLPLSQWQTNTTGNFDGSGNLSTNLPNTATNLQEFYTLKVQ